MSTNGSLPRTKKADAATNGPKQVPLTCTGHTRPVVDLHFSGFTESNDFFLISACKDSIPILRRGDTGDWVGNFQGHKGAVWAARLSNDATTSVTGSADFTARVWDNVQGTTKAVLQHSHVVRSVDISEDARYILTGGYEKKLRVFDLQSPDPETPIRVMDGNQNEIKSVLLDSTHGLVFNGDGKELKVWDLRDSKQVSSRFFNNEVSSLKFSFDRSKIICTEGKKVHFYNSITAALEYEFDVKVDVSSASLHPDGSRFVIGGSSDLWARVYDFYSGQEMEVYKGHHGPIHCVSYSPDGQLYATGSEDGTVRLWQTYPGTPYGLWQSSSE